MCSLTVIFIDEETGGGGFQTLAGALGLKWASRGCHGASSPGWPHVLVAGPDPCAQPESHHILVSSGRFKMLSPKSVDAFELLHLRRTENFLALSRKQSTHMGPSPVVRHGGLPQICYCTCAPRDHTHVFTATPFMRDSTDSNPDAQLQQDL